MLNLTAGELGAVPGVLGLDHVGIAVADLDDAVALYAGLWGLHIAHRSENPEQGVAELMLTASPPPPTAAAPVASRPVDAPGATEIQLLAPLTEQSPVGRFLRRRGPGLHHLALRVERVDVAAAALHDRGLRLTYDAAKVGARGSLINFVYPRDAGGVLLELVQPAGLVR